MAFSYTSDGWVNVWCDGACPDNGRSRARAGIGVFFADNSKWNVSAPIVGKATNIVAEILAATRACHNAWQANIQRLQVNTDSEFVVKCMNEWLYTWQRNGFRTANNEPVANEAEIKALAKAADRIQTRWVHVRGHGTNYGNKQADALARNGAEQYVNYN